ncbi:methyltransferase [Lentzea sp. NBRC 105346]|uniref:class I SAM-dependent methyltransferase n=1 Tax=Lentzea sp. NBRC 105346 TaxID=3032205 RepID=UPI0024A0CE7F|nr:class I SAM-dependent methyltransferase [Lentzea sp. NBRC 105346]GLZ31846.1 methyltransferase [Lentzea sp. NBRC 105346]
MTYVFPVEGSVDQHDCLAEAYDPITCGRLESLGITAQWRCLDVGTGAGSIARWLAERAGSVLATDVEPLVSPAPRLVVLRHDIARDPLPHNTFDLIVARLVLRHLPTRERVLRKLVDALKPGGWLQVDEFDTTYEPVLCAPDRALYEKFMRAKNAVFSAAGVDCGWGREAARAMVSAGLIDVDPVPFVQPWRAGVPGVRLLAGHTHRLRDRLVAAGMTGDELERVRELLADHRFRASSSVFYSVQGRRPW